MELKILIPAVFYGSVILTALIVGVFMFVNYMKQQKKNLEARNRRKKFKVIKGSKRDATFFKE